VGAMAWVRAWTKAKRRACSPADCALWSAARGQVDQQVPVKWYLRHMSVPPSVLGGWALPRKTATRVLAGMQDAKAASLLAFSTLTWRLPPDRSAPERSVGLGVLVRLAAASSRVARDGLGMLRCR